MPQPKEELYTIDYIYSLPDDERVELIDGIIYTMQAPKRVHQKIQQELSLQIGNVIKKNHGECEIYPAPFGVVIDDRNYVEPDISIICDKNKLTDNGCEGIPEIIIEIASQNNKRNDYVIKLNKYMNAGIFEYIIIDPMEKLIFIYRKSEGYVPKVVSIFETFEIEIIRNCKIKLEKDILK